jgi:hypothetical protein
MLKNYQDTPNSNYSVPINNYNLLNNNHKQKFGNSIQSISQYARSSYGRQSV